MRLILSETQIPEFKSSIKELFKGIHLCTEQPLLRGNRPLNIASEAFNYSSFSHLSVFSKSHKDLKSFSWKLGHCLRLSRHIPTELNYTDSTLIMSILTVLEQRKMFESDAQFKALIMQHASMKKNVVPTVGLTSHLSETLGLNVSSSALSQMGLSSTSIISQMSLGSALAGKRSPWVELSASLNHTTLRHETLSSHKSFWKDLANMQKTVDSVMRPYSGILERLNKLNRPLKHTDSVSKLAERLKKLNEPITRMTQPAQILSDRLNQFKDQP